MFDDDYELVPVEGENIFALKLIDGPFTGITYSYNKCGVSEEEDHAVLTFEYDIMENREEEYDTKLFEKYIGNILLDLIEKQLATNSVIYSGGVEE